MSNPVKLQAPLRDKEGAFYPLTTYDQIIMPDGVSRWNGATGEGGTSSTAPVTSVNGQTGEVVLDANNIGALPNTYKAPVISVNGQTDEVVLDANSVGALPNTYKAPVTSVNGQVGDVTISTGGVTSVNGQAGAVTIPVLKYADATFTFSGEDAASYTTVPSGLSDVKKIISINSYNNSIIFTRPEIISNKIYVKCYNPGSLDTDDWEKSVSLYTESFTARIFYF